MQITYSCDLYKMIASHGSKSNKFNFTLDDTSMVTSDKEYPGTNDFTYDFPYESTFSLAKDALSIPFAVDALFLPYSQMISNAEISEYGQKFGSANPLIGKENKLLFDRYTLVGIIRSDFFRISSRKDSPQFIVPFSDKLLTVQDEQEADTLSFITIINSSNYSNAIHANALLINYGRPVSLSSTVALYAGTEM